MTTSWTATTPDGVIKWAEGFITGDALIIDTVQRHLFASTSIAVTPTGPFVAPDVRDPLAVAGVLCNLYAGKLDTSDDFPDFTFDVPEGAVM